MRVTEACELDACQLNHLENEPVHHRDFITSTIDDNGPKLPIDFVDIGR
jgi:hypothetical protein